MANKGRSYSEFREKLLSDLAHNGYTEREVQIVEEALGLWGLTHSLVYAFSMGMKRPRHKKPLELPEKAEGTPDETL